MKSEPDEDPEPDPDSMPDPDPDPEPVELVKSWTTVHRPASYEGFEVKVAG